MNANINEVCKRRHEKKYLWENWKDKKSFNRINTRHSHGLSHRTMIAHATTTTTTTTLTFYPTIIIDQNIFVVLSVSLEVSATAKQ